MDYDLRCQSIAHASYDRGGAMGYRGPPGSRQPASSGVAYNNHNSHISLPQLMYATSNIYLAFQNFLRNPCFVETNLLPDKDGFCSVKFDASLYSTGLIIGLDDKSSSQQIIDLGDAAEEIEKRDLSLQQPFDAEKYYNETRQCKIALGKERFEIEDITSTEHIIIDSLDKVKKVQDEIIRILGFQKMNKDLECLLKWNTFDEEEKNKQYSKYCSHETNMFIKFKDPDYFVKVVRPFLLQKMEKDFMDHWLLDNAHEIEKYKRVEMFDQLNAMEQALLVHSIAQKDAASANEIASLMKLRADKADRSETQKNQIFDTVLNLNILNKDSQNKLVQEIKEMLRKPSSPQMAMEKCKKGSI